MSSEVINTKEGFAKAIIEWDSFRLGGVLTGTGRLSAPFTESDASILAQMIIELTQCVNTSNRGTRPISITRIPDYLALPMESLIEDLRPNLSPELWEEDKRGCRWCEAVGCKFRIR